MAAFESEVRITGEGTFVESGTIRYDSAGSVTFTTVGQGVLGPSGIDGLQRGAVMWDVKGVDGMLAGASGLVTSNFSVGAAGDERSVDLADHDRAIWVITMNEMRILAEAPGGRAAAPDFG